MGGMQAIKGGFGRRSGSTAFAIAVLAACIGGTATPALAQATYFYRGGTRTWSTGTNWWTTYSGSTAPGSGPGVSDTAVFNVRGQAAAVTATFTSDASVQGILGLATGTGAITLQGDGVANPTLSLGAGGIRTLANSGAGMQIGSAAANTGLNVTLGASQQWSLRSGAIGVLNNVAGSAADGSAQTLYVQTANTNAVFSGTVSDGANGGKLNLWVNAGNITLPSTANASTLTGTLTLQSIGKPGNQFYTVSSGTYAVDALQLIGGGLSGGQRLWLSKDGAAVNLLGGASNFAYTYVPSGPPAESFKVTNATVSRPVGGGIWAWDIFLGTVTNSLNVNGLIPWANGQGAGGRGTWQQNADGTISGYTSWTNGNVTSWTQVNSATGNYAFGNAAPRLGTLTANAAGSFLNFDSANKSGANRSLDLAGGYTLTTNGIGAYTGDANISSSSGRGALVIGSAGELIINNDGGTVGLSAPIRESVAGSWLTYGASNRYAMPIVASLTLSGSNSYTGGTSLLSGTVRLNNPYALGTGTLQIGGNAIVLDNTTGAALTLATNNRQKWNSDFTFAGTNDLNLGSGTVSLGDWAGTMRTVTVNAGTLTVGGRIEDGTYTDLPTKGLVKDGAGTLVLSGSNGYTGPTEVWGGDLRMASTNALYGGDTTKWTAANVTVLAGGVLSASVGSGAGAFTAANLDTLAGMASDTGGFQSNSYLGIDTSNVSGTYTYASNLSNNVVNGGTNVLGIAKVGTGTLVLSGSNTFTGGVIVRGGTLLVTSTQQIGSGTLVVAGGLLDMSGLTFGNRISMQSGTVVNASLTTSLITNNLTGTAVFSGTLAGSLGKSGTGMLVLTAANNFTSFVTLSAGLLSISSSANIGSGTIRFQGGGLQVTGTSLTSLPAGTLFFTNNSWFDIANAANTLAVSQTIQTGTGGLTKSGPGALLLSGTNTYSGATTISGGTLRMGSATALGSTSAITAAGGVLDLNGNAVTTTGVVTLDGGGALKGGSLSTNSGGVYPVNAGYAFSSGTVSTNLAGTTNLHVVSGTTLGPRLVVLSGSNSYTGWTYIDPSTDYPQILLCATRNSLYGGDASKWTTANIQVSYGNQGGAYATLALGVGGTDGFQASDVTALLANLDSNYYSGFNQGSSIGFDTTNAAGGSFTFADTIINGVGLVKLGSGTLVVSGSNSTTNYPWGAGNYMGPSYPGETAVGYRGGPDAGTLQLASTSYLGGIQAVAIYAGTFDANGQNRSIFSLTLGGGAPGTTAGLQTGSGTVTLGPPSWAWWADQTGAVTFDGSTASAEATIAGNLSLGGATRPFIVGDSAAAAADLTVSAVIGDGGGPSGLAKYGTGVLALSGSNTFTGRTAIGDGALQIAWINDSGASPLGANTTTDLGNQQVTGTLRWVGATPATTSRVFNLTGTAGGGGAIDAGGVGALTLTGSVTADNGTQTLVLTGTSTARNTIGRITNPTSGVLSVVKDGPGVWQLTGTSNFAGGLTVKSGTALVLATASITSGGPGALGTGNVTVGDASAGASGTAALLISPGARSSRVIRVAALGAGATQSVVIGSYDTTGTSASFQQNRFQLGRDVTLVATTGGTTTFGNTWTDATGSGTPGVNITVGTAGSQGTVTLSNELMTTGAVGVRFGTLNVEVGRTVTSAGPLTVDLGATLAGAGTVAGTIGGAGLVAPGNSPGILTAQAVAPASGLAWAFEFSGTGAPNYADATSSFNDVLRLTGTAPFATALAAGNTVSLYLPQGVVLGNTFEGGFFTDLMAVDLPNLLDLVSGGSFVAYEQVASGTTDTFYNGAYYTPLAARQWSVQVGVKTVPYAGFSGDTDPIFNGQVTTFAIVPEPSTLALAAVGAALAGWSLRRRRPL